MSRLALKKAFPFVLSKTNLEFEVKSLDFSLLSTTWFVAGMYSCYLWCPTFSLPNCVKVILMEVNAGLFSAFIF